MYGVLNRTQINGASVQHVTAEATGFMTGAFGTPSSVATLEAAGFSPTQFGRPASPYARAFTADGWIVTKAGRPVVGYYSPAVVHRFFYPGGTRSTSFGTAVAAWARYQTASGAATTTFGAASVTSTVAVLASGAQFNSFGTPSHALGLGATGIDPVALFGTARAVQRGTAAGNKSTAFGTPTSIRAQHAASTYRAARWGTPGTVRSDTYLARGLYSPARFAQPTAWRLSGFAASGSTSTRFGASACRQRYRALHAAPACRFGKPLMLWGTPC